jgi:hypothetical protein
LKSRCTSPAACAAASPSPARRKRPRISRHGRGSQPLAQRAAVDELHRDVEPIVDAPDLVDGDDLGMAQPRQRLRLPPQPGLEPRVAQVGPHDLERELAIELAVVRFVDRAHAAATDEPEHDEAPDRHAGREPALLHRGGIARRERRSQGGHVTRPAAVPSTVHATRNAASVGPAGRRC